MRVIPRTLSSVAGERRKIWQDREALKRKLIISKALKNEDDPLKILDPEDEKRDIEALTSLLKRKRFVPSSTVQMRYKFETQRLSLHFDYEEKKHNGNLIY